MLSRVRTVLERKKSAMAKGRQKQSGPLAGMFPVGVSLTEIPEEAKVRAVSRVLAAQANAEERVRQFRRTILKSSLLAPDAVEGWIRTHADEEGEPSYWL